MNKYNGLRENIKNYDACVRIGGSLFFKQLENFLSEFSSMKYIVETRFHANVLAMKFRQPFFSVIYNDKTLNLLEDMGANTKDCYDIRRGQELTTVKK